MNVSQQLKINFVHSFPASVRTETQLDFFEIHFDTSTYDKVDRDIKVTVKILSPKIHILMKKRDPKVTVEAQLGLIGGTLGLLTGFSILSGVEIIYFAGKFFFSLLHVKS